MLIEYPRMVYWHGGRTQGHVVENAEEEAAWNAKGWFVAQPILDDGTPIWPDGMPGAGLVELVALAPKTSFIGTESDFHVGTPEETDMAENAMEKPKKKSKK